MLDRKKSLQNTGGAVEQAARLSEGRWFDPGLQLSFGKTLNPNLLSTAGWCVSVCKCSVLYNRASWSEACRSKVKKKKEMQKKNKNVFIKLLFMYFQKCVSVFFYVHNICIYECVLYINTYTQRQHFTLATIRKG